MLILGCDIATVSGFALFDTRKDVSAIEAWSVQVKGNCHEAKAAQLGWVLHQIVRDKKPDLIAVEQPLKNIKQYDKIKTDLAGTHKSKTVSPSTVILPNQLAGAVMGIIGAMGKPWVTIPPETWRATFLGFGRKKGWSRDDWKRAARKQCQMEGIAVTNNDQSDAVGVAIAARATDIYRQVRNQLQEAA